jgi:hypothetical protein
MDFRQSSQRKKESRDSAEGPGAQGGKPINITQHQSTSSDISKHSFRKRPNSANPGGFEPRFPIHAVTSYQ